jgi:hypothetical protein
MLMAIHNYEEQISRPVYRTLSVWLLMVVLLTILMSACSARAQCVGVTVYPGDNNAIQATLEANPTGTAFCFQPGTYRFKAPISPKDNQVLISQQKGAAILSGAQTITDFQMSGNNWVATGFLPSSPTLDAPPCQEGTLCDYDESVFFDSQLLTRVLALNQLVPGTYYEDYPNNKIYLADNPTGHAVEQAVAASIIQVCQANSPHCSNGVQVQDFVVEKTANPSEMGAIDAEGTNNWLVLGNEVRLNHGVGIEVDGATIQANYSHHNGQSGIEGTCAPYPAGSQNPTACLPDATHQLQILDNELAFNNTLKFSAQFGAGGGKWAATRNMVVRGNNVHDNLGPGLWCDITCYNALFEYNTLTNNVLNKTNPNVGDGAGGGIIYEVSNKAIIRNNTFGGNGPNPALGNDGFGLSADILIAESTNVQVYNNTLQSGSNEINAIGMTMNSLNFDQSGNGLGRTDWCGIAPNNTYPDGSLFCTGRNSLSQPIHLVRNANIHDNTSTETSAGEKAGLDTDMGTFGLRYFTTTTGLYQHNTYHLPDPVNGTYFSWNCAHQGACPLLTPGQWQAAGQDLTSTFTH